jgi:DNA-binding response OmpR family regulator
VLNHDESINLTPIEFKLLVVLAKHPGRTYSREELVEKVMGFDFEGDLRTIDQHIKNLRHKIEKNPKEPTYISTVYGIGYKFTGGKK